MRIGVALLSTIFLTTTAKAGVPASADNLETMTTHGTRQESATMPTPEEARDALNRTAGGVGLVLSDSFRDGKAATVKDMLDFVPGVFAQPKYGQEDARLSIRGSGLSRNFHLRGIRLLIDRMPLNAADGSGDFQELDPLAYRYIEVFRGGNALQYGASSLGGAVNFVSFNGRNDPGVLLRAEGGSFGTWRLQAAGGGQAGNWDFYLTPTFSKSDGFRDHAEQEYARLSGNVGYRFGEGVETRFYLSLNDLDQDIPGSLTLNQALTAPRSTPASSFSQDTQRDIQSVRIANRTVFPVGDWTIAAGGFYSYKDLFHPLSFGVIDVTYRNGGLFLRGEGDGTLAGRRNETVLGVNVILGRNRSRIFQNLGGEPGFAFSNAVERAANYEFYAENRFFVTPAVSLVGGLQVVHAVRKLRDEFLPNGDDSGRDTFDSVNPKLGAIWEVTPDIQLFTNVSWASEPPTMSELNPSAAPGFADLKPQKAITFEIGSRGAIDGLRWDVSFYRAWLEDELLLLVVPGSTDSGFAVNADKTLHQGIELGVDVAVAKGIFAVRGDFDSVNLRLAWTWSDFRFRNDAEYGDNKLPGAPPHYLRAELRYDHPDGFYVAPNVEWVPKGYFVDNANTENQRTPSYALLGLKAGCRFESGLAFYIEGRNLTDKVYISNTHALPVAGPGSALYNPGEGRAVYGGIEIAW